MFKFLTFEGTRHQYVGGVPEDITKRIDPRLWEEDWRIMSLPGRLKTHRALVPDNRTHVARFGTIARYLARWQPAALMLPHLLLETRSAECAALMSAFVKHVKSSVSAA